jgi:hypothetical protein
LRFWKRITPKIRDPAFAPGLRVGLVCSQRLPGGGQVPRIENEDAGTFDVDEGKRMVLAIEENTGVDILHDVGPASGP